MPKVVISGYYGFHNSGDEAILHAMLLALKGAVPGLEATVLSGDPAYTAREFGVRSIVRDNPLTVFRALMEADLLISGGGGLLQDVTGPKSIIYYLGVVTMALLLKKPVFFYAQGIGPVNTRLGRTLVRLVADRVDAITVRDRDSKQELASLGVTRPPVRVTADPALGLEPGQIDRVKGRAVLSALGLDGGRPVAGISVRPWKGQDGYVEAVAGAADDLAGDGWQVLLVPMHFPGDDVTCRAVAARMKGTAFILGRGTDYKDLLAVTANLGLAVGMRLHFLIFSAISGVPLVGIPYDPKVNLFLQAVGLPPGLSAEGLNYGDLSAAIRKVLADRERISTGIKEKMAVLRGEAKKNAALAAELFAPV